ncbi:MAG TPA: ABC transporter ATP-binding protein [Flavobacteriales bacterium]|nr:ABC transporter ATP-binding protein [Flavobacteriales bacterium]
MRPLAKILRYARPYRKYATMNILLNILSAIFNLLSLLLFIPFLKLLFQDPAQLATMSAKPDWNALGFKEYFVRYQEYLMSSSILEYGKEGVLLFICICIVVLFFLKNLTRYFAMYWMTVIRANVVKDLRNSMFNKLAAQSLGYYTNERKGDIISRVSGDVAEVEWSVMSTLELLFREPFTIIIFMVSMFLISVKLTLISLVLIPISALIIGRISKSLKRSSAKGQTKLGELISTLEESLGGIRIIKSFNAENHVKKNFHNQNREFTRLQMRIMRKRDLASPMSEFLGSLVLTALVWIGGNMVFDDGKAFTGEQFIGFVIVFSQLMRPVQGVASAISSIHKGLASIDRIDAIINSEVAVVDKPNALNNVTFNENLQYKTVEFSYADKLVLNKISLEIKKGQTIALVGPSGSGKSTMADLLPRFYDVQGGEILVDGVNVKDVEQKALRRLFGIVSQESILFNDSILNNIALGDVNPDMDRAVEAAKIANAHEFIERTENGYHSNIGDRGTKLSGGQRQRLCIARAVYKNPPVLILDEATSALDTESEKLVQEALENVMKNRTVLVIAHRLSTVQNADKIVVLEEGNIVEQGTHAELVTKNGLYNKLVKMQNL